MKLFSIWKDNTFKTGNGQIYYLLIFT